MPNTVNSAKVSVQVNWDFSATNPGQNPRSHTDVNSKALAYTNGAGANQIEEIYSAVRTITPSGTDNVDLAGALTNLLGDASIVFTKVKAILVRLLGAAETAIDGTAGTAASSITVGNAAANAFVGPFGAAAHTLTVQNGGFLMIATGSAGGYAVTASTGDILKVLNNDAGVSAVVQLTVFGAKT